MTGATGSDTGAASPDTGTTSPDTGTTSPDTGTTSAGTDATGKDTDAKSPAAAAGGSLGRFGYLLPVAVFVIIGIGLGVGLTRDPSTLPSALIDKPVPEFELPAVLAAGFDKPGLASSDLTGRVQLVNVFASWCGPCRVEHPFLMRMARDGVIVQGFNYKDNPEDAVTFLNELGDPYEKIGADRDGRAGIEWGVYGVPETFIIDAEGNIRHKHVGPITNNTQIEELMTIIGDLEK